MTLWSAPELFASARRRGYALGYFESWNLESLLGVIDAAEQTRSPVILGFNGEFLTGTERAARERIELYAGLGLAAAETASVPCCLFFNECPLDPPLYQAVEKGFNFVMLADPHATIEDYTQRLAQLASYAHARGAAVEAELGELPNGAAGLPGPSDRLMTDPAQAAQLVAATGADILAVSVGNVHVLLEGELSLDLDRLAEIHRRLDIPLSLHGGSGIPADSLRKAIHLGVAKVAYGTYLKQRYLAAVRKALESDEQNPHKLLGIGGPQDLLVAARQAVRDAVLERIEFLGLHRKSKMNTFPIQKLIPEATIVIFAPHYDDVLLGLGSYILELKEHGFLADKRFHILQIFTRSNYQAGSGAANFDTSLERIKLATGRRLLEELDCLDELFGEHAYHYELLGERECFLRDKVMADSEMEFPHGMYEEFNELDKVIFARLQGLVQAWAGLPDTALVFPLAIKEHIDHFLAREAGITVARQLGGGAKARFYFQEDKPYAGIQTPQEAARIEQFLQQNDLQPRPYRAHPEEVVRLAFKHYTSQVEEVYRKGVINRAAELQALYGLGEPADRLFAYEPR